MTDKKQNSFPGFLKLAESLPKIKKPDENIIRLLDKAELIRNGDLGEILYQHTVFCQTGLPYRDPGPNVVNWDRFQGYASLRIRAGDIFDQPSGKWQPVGLPFGPKPRLILLYLNAEALRTGSPDVEVEDSLTGFVKRIGLPSKGKNIRVIKDQLSRLSTAEIKLSMQFNDRVRQTQGHIVSGFDLWFPKHENQRVLWPTVVTLSQEYFKSLINHAVPLSENAIMGLRNNALALDVYSWMAQRLHRVPRDRAQFIAWARVKEQFGPDYGRMDNFKRVFRGVLKKVRQAYPDSRFKIDKRGMTLFNSPSPVPKRYYSLPQNA